MRDVQEKFDWKSIDVKIVPKPGFLMVADPLAGVLEKCGKMDPDEIFHRASPKVFELRGDFLSDRIGFGILVQSQLPELNDVLLTDLPLVQRVGVVLM